MVFENPSEARARTTKALKKVFAYFNKAYDILEESGREAAHARDHVYPAALEAMRVAEENARKQGLNPDSVKALANIAGITAIVHDLIRRAGETGKTGLSDLSQSDGFKTVRLLESRRNAWLNQIREGKIKEDETGLTFLTDSEFNAVKKAIQDNELPLEKIREKLEDENKPVLEKIVLLGLTWGDKGREGLGAKVVERRAQFVAGERHDTDPEMKPFVEKLLKGEGKKGEGAAETEGEGKKGEGEGNGKKGEGAAETKKFTVEDTKKLAFLLESLRRIRALKVASDYPLELVPEVERMRKMEEDVYYSLIKHFNFESENELLEFGLKHGYPGLKEYVEKIKENIPAESKKIISLISEEKANQAAQLVLHYAHPKVYAQPSGEYADKWVSEIKAESKRKAREEFEKLVNRL